MSDYNSPLNTLNTVQRDHEPDDVIVSVSMFNALGILEGHEEVCSCSVGMFNMNTLPEGGYVTAIEVPLHFH